MIDLAETSLRSEDRLLVLLPAHPVGAGAEAHWWQVRGEAVVASQVSSQWLEFAKIPIVALAPTEALRLVLPGQIEGTTKSQRLTLARIAALEGSIADPGTLHASAAIIDTAAGEGRALVALAGNDIMLGWLDWAERLGARIDHIVPAAMVLPFDEGWASAAVGNERIIGRLGTVVPDESGLIEVLVDGPVESMTADQIEASLVRIAAQPRPDLRSGPFARRRIWIDRSQRKLLSALVAATLMVAVLTAIAQIVKLERATSRLEAETAALTERAGSTATAPLTPTLARLLSIVSSQPGMAVASLGADGRSINVTIAASSPASIEAFVRSLERDGYRVTARPRNAIDGRATANIQIVGAR